MSIVANIPKALGQASYKLAISRTANGSGGTSAIVTGLNTIVSGGAIVTSGDSATSATQDTAAVTSVSGGTVNVSLALLTFSGPTIALDTSTSKHIHCWAFGY